MNKKLLIFIAAVLLVALIGAIYFGLSDDDIDVNSPSPSMTNQSEINTETSSEVISEGNYVEYSEAGLANSDTPINILFFHAVWCTVCNSVERSIEASTIPQNMTIFKIDYDSPEGRQLAEKYDIAIQYSSVQVDVKGQELTKWINQYNDGPSEFLSRTVES